MRKILLALLIAVLASATGYAKSTQNEVTVKTVVEFIKAINDDTTIKVPWGTELNISTVLNSAPEILEYLGIGEYNEDLYSFYDRNDLLQCPKGVYRREVYKGYELVIVGYRNLNIVCTDGGEMPMILVNCAYANVMTFVNCANITIENFVIGHNVEPGYCTGAVLNFCVCYDVKVSRCYLFGCGTYGITGDWVEGLNVSRTRIYDCTYGITEINHSSNVTFDMCLMDHNEEFGLISINTTDNAAVISRSIIAQNVGTLFASRGITLKGCLVSHSGDLGKYKTENYDEIPTTIVGPDSYDSYFNDNPDWYYDAFYKIIDGDFSVLVPKASESLEQSQQAVDFPWPAECSLYDPSFPNLVRDLSLYDSRFELQDIAECIVNGVGGAVGTAWFILGNYKNGDNYASYCDVASDIDCGINMWDYDDGNRQILVLNSRDIDRGYRQLTFYQYDKQKQAFRCMTRDERPFDDFIGNYATDVFFQMPCGGTSIQAVLTGLETENGCVTVDLKWNGATFDAYWNW